MADRVNHAWYSSVEKLDDENHKRSNHMEMKDIGKVVGRFEKNATPEIRLAMQIAKVQAAWEKIAPQEVLDHTDDVYVFKKDDGRHFVIYVDSPLWAADLSVMKERYRRDMEKELDDGPIDDIRFLPSHIAKEHHAFRKQTDTLPAEPDDVPSISLTDEEYGKLVEEASVIDDGKLREAFLKARIASAEWKKGIDAAKRR